jgi:hypothetical protein
MAVQQLLTQQVLTEERLYLSSQQQHPQVAQQVQALLLLQFQAFQTELPIPLQLQQLTPMEHQRHLLHPTQ